MTWTFLILAGLFEMLGHQKVFLLILGFGASFLCLFIAMASLPMGTAYAVWTGLEHQGRQ